MAICGCVTKYWANIVKKKESMNSLKEFESWKSCRIIQLHVSFFFGFLHFVCVCVCRNGELV